MISIIKKPRWDCCKLELISKNKKSKLVPTFPFFFKNLLFHVVTPNDEFYYNYLFIYYYLRKEACLKLPIFYC